MMQVGTRTGVGDFGFLMKALGVASDVRKLGVTVVGFVVTVTLANLLIGLNSVGGASSSVPPNAFRPAPDLTSNIASTGLTALLALVVWWVGSSLTIATVTRMSVGQLSGDENQARNWRTALDYVTAHLDGFLLGPLVFGLILLALFIVELLVLFIGRIPYLGELLIGLAFLPLLLINLFGVIAVVFGWFLLFPVVAVDGLGPIAASTRVLEFIRGDPIRIVLQLVIAFFVAFLVTAILSMFVFTSLAITVALAAVGLGDKSAQIVASMIPFVGQLAGFFGIGPPPFTIVIARFLITLAIDIFWWGFLALPLVFVIASCSALYLAGTQPPRRLEPFGEPAPMPPAQPLEPVAAAADGVPQYAPPVGTSETVPIPGTVPSAVDTPETVHTPDAPHSPETVPTPGTGIPQSTLQGPYTHRRRYTLQRPYPLQGQGIRL
jgi:hypothetical protein